MIESASLFETLEMLSLQFDDNCNSIAIQDNIVYTIFTPVKEAMTYVPY
jgi:hypothetical protein